MTTRTAQRSTAGTSIGSRRLLDLDPDLGEGLDPDKLLLAQRHLVTPVIELPAGHSWEAPGDAAEHRGQLGLLVIDGLLTRDVVLARTTCAELVGEGDLLRPWDHVGEGGSVPFEIQWDVLVPTRLAVLDRRFTTIAGRLPEVTTEIVSRAVRRSHWLGLHLAIRCLRRVDARLLVLFWHMAERWGRVTPQGIVLPLSLTHELLARLVGAQRPSVTTALGELAERDVAVHEDGGWLLTGDLPEKLERIYAGRPAPRVAEGQGIFARVDAGD